jgi:hypothetical protein
MNRQAFGEESVSRAEAQGRPRKVRQAKNKVNSMLIIFFDIKKIVLKEYVLADQIVNSTYCCDILRRLHENVRRIRLELW